MILVAIESRTIRTQIERLCVDAGLPAIACGSVAEAIAALSGESVRLLVLDDQFPDGRGADLLTRLKRPEGDTIVPAISISSAAVLEAYGEAGLRLAGHVAKPDLMTRLIPEICRHLPDVTAPALGRVLVIDDSRTYREKLRVSLQAAGYEVETAETGEDGVRCAFAGSPDAVLVDSMLPGIDGIAVIRRLRGEAATRRTPALLLTASEDPRQELEALDAGADTFVRKDEDMAVILARLASILRSASTPAASSLAALPQLPRRVVLIGESGGGLDILEGVGQVMREEGCETVSLHPADASIARCVMLEPDLLLFAAPMDERLLEFCRNFKSASALRNSRLLVLDVSSEWADARSAAVAAIQAGADEYLPAQSESSVVLARAKSQLRRKRMEDENRGLREHMLRQELETEAQRALAETRSRHAEEMRLAYGVAEQKATEAERARLELEQVTEGIPQIVWTTDATGRATRFNRRWSDFTGLSREGITNHVWRRAIHRDDRSRALHDWAQSFRNGSPYTSEYRLCSTAGEYRWFLVRAIPLLDERGRIDRWFGTCTDIHDQKLGEEVLRRTEKLAATGRLAASIAHEINNPLEAVTNLLYLIETTTREMPETHEFVQTAQKELDRVAQISKKTLAFYRESTNAAEVHLGELVGEVMEIYSVRLKGKRIRLEVEEHTQLRPQALGGELRQVISNLLTNAIDASPENSVIRIRIRGANWWGENGKAGVRISIGDHGHGIPESLRMEMFKPFTTTKGAKGTGLGLWLSHSIVERHGGRLSLRSRTDGALRGTCFSIHLPLVLGVAPKESDSMGSMLRTIGKELLGQ